ncbi:MAG: tetratricopeptide repeat protein [Myxococcales bacterium]|nr:tetratricopeptide repeat protein [Myxococcales bacterium]
MSIPKAVVVLGLAALATLAAGVAAAQSTPDSKPNDAVQAEALYDRAIVLSAAGDWSAACERFAASMKLDPAASTQIQLGRCLERSGKLAQAWYAYRQALKLNPELTVGEERRQKLEDLANQKLAQLEPRIPKIVLALSGRPPGLEVRCDGQLVGSLDEPLWIDVGEHALIAEAPGYQRLEVRLNAEEGKTSEVLVKLLPSPAGAPDAAAPKAGVSTTDRAGSALGSALGSVPDSPLADVPGAVPRVGAAGLAPAVVIAESPPAPWTSRRVGGVALSTLGGLGLGAAGLLGIVTVGNVAKLTACSEDLSCANSEQVTRHAAATSTQTAAFVALGIGAAALGTGVVLLLVKPSRDARAAVALSPGGAALRGAW